MLCLIINNHKRKTNMNSFEAVHIGGMLPLNQEMETIDNQN